MCQRVLTRLDLSSRRSWASLRRVDRRSSVWLASSSPRPRPSAGWQRRTRRSEPPELGGGPGGRYSWHWLLLLCWSSCHADVTSLAASRRDDRCVPSGRRSSLSSLGWGSPSSPYVGFGVIDPASA